ncbi:MAG: outer membrane beta-barrel protein [bacterium]|nr:outer membrane beta-barrel protein [bacterium]
MKKHLIIFILLIFVASGFAMAENAKKTTFHLKVGYNALMPADSTFKEIYADKEFFPEVRIGIHLFKSIYVWGGYGTFSDDGQVTFYEFTEDVSAKQTFMSFGLGYQGMFSKSLGYSLEVGGVSFKFEEDGMGENVSETAMGFRGNLGINFNVSKNIFIEAFGGYMSGSKDVGNRSVKLGGMVGGLALGLKF